MIIKAALNIMVRNLDQSVAFYTDILGLTLKKRYSAKYAEVQAANITIGLHKEIREDSAKKSCSVLVGFQVEDIASAVENLESKGIAFNGGIEEGVGGKFAYFSDPDGNVLYLWQNKP